MGWGTEQYQNGYFGKLILGSGTHYITGNVSVPQSVFGTQGFVEFGTSNTYIGGNLDLTSTTVTPGTATIHMNSTAAGKNITTNNQALPNLVFNGVGGEWTLQDDLIASSIIMSKGRLYDNAKTITSNGSIMLSDVANLLTSTGNWIMAGNGSINNFVTDPDYASNIFNNLTIKTGVTANVNDYLNVKKLVIEDSVALTGKFLHFYPEESNFFIQGENDTSSLLSIKIHKNLGTENITLEQGKINFPDTPVFLAYGTGVIYKMTSFWTIGSLHIAGGGSDDTELQATALDTNGYDLTVNGDLKMGLTRLDFINKFHAKLLLKSGTHRISGTLQPYDATPNATHGYIDFGSSTTYIGGNVVFANITQIGTNTGIVLLNGSGSQTFTNTSSVKLNNLQIENSSSTGVTFNGGLSLDGTFTNNTPSSEITFASGSTYSFPNIVLNGGALGSRIYLRSSTSGSPWKLNVSDANHSVQYVDVADSDASGGLQIKANDGTSIDGGGNSNWLFGNYQTDINEVTISPSRVEINPKKSIRFRAKAFNAQGQEVAANFEWSSTSAGSITDNGLFTAGEAVGLFNEAVTVTTSGKTAKADVNIIKETPYVKAGWIIISPDSKVLKPKESYQFEGKVYDTTGLLIENANPEWQLVDGGGEITTDGLFTAGESEGIFVNSIVASYADVRSYATVVVRGDTSINEKKDETVISKIVQAGKVVMETAKNVAKNDSAKEVALAVTAVATASAGISGMLGLVSMQMGVKDYLLFIINYFLSLRAAKRKNKFGTVYDESTQRPLSKAMVRLFDFKTMRLVSTAITDKNGDYIFIVQPGEYVMSVIKPGYAFPSKMIRISQNLADNYIGQTIVVNNDHPIINQRIPVDPSGNQQIKLGLLFRLLNSIYFRPIVLILGSAMTIYSLILSPVLLNYILAGGFVLLWLAEAFIQNRNVRFSRVIDGSTNKPIPLALVRVLTAENKLAETFISDQYGRVLPKIGTTGSNIIVEKSGYNKIIEPAKNNGLVERRNFNLRRSNS